MLTILCHVYLYARVDGKGVPQHEGEVEEKSLDRKKDGRPLEKEQRKHYTVD
jgi:hypothetical protein